MSKISLRDRIICDSVIKIPRRLLWKCHAYRPFPFFRRGSARVRDLYCFSALSLSEAREVVKWYEYTLNETKYPWALFKCFVIAISNEGISDTDIMEILKKVARRIEKEKVNKLLGAYSWFVAYKL
jgi:hypothetical protein